MSILALVTLTGSLTLSLFVKDSRLWMDEVLSYLLLSDPSSAHVNRAIVSGMDANPPLFVNLYWLIGHGISLNPFFLKAVSIGLFALAVALFYRYVVALLGRPTPWAAQINLMVSLAVVSLTYLNYTLSTQIRTYSLYLLLGWAYVMVLHRLIHQPRSRFWLVAHVLTGTAFLFTHNVALFYIAGSGLFFGLLWLVTRNPGYLAPVGVHALLAAVWLVFWFPSFAIQAQSGLPHSWIPVPTFQSFFRTIGDLLPAVSSGLEQTYPALTVVRVGGVLVLLGWVGTSHFRQKGRQAMTSKAFSLFVLSGFLVTFTLLLGLAVSLVHTSIFLNRYFWPSSLLLLYQLLFSGWWLFSRASSRLERLSHLTASSYRTGERAMLRLLPRPLMGVFLLLLSGFIVIQNRKVPLFSGQIVRDVDRLTPGQPVLFESAYYFLPIRFYQANHPTYYLLDWPTALDRRNVLESTTDYKIIEGVAQHYQLSGILSANQFNGAQFARRFYVVDEVSRYQIEAFVATGRVKINQIIPTTVAGHRILDCSF